MAASPNRARDLFLAAVRQAPDQWDAFLAAECGGDEALRDRVRELLAAHGEAGSFLDPAAALALTTDEPAGERPGTVIGPYKLLEQIGEGGFGVVFLAEQQEPVRRKVALKVLKPGMDTRQVVARFEAERQALALMDHPHIAKVFDGGQTPAGRLYFVMELVKGMPITRFCDDQRLAPRDRLGLFVQVCQAVQHAHQKGVIHRDLKPSNVLVTVHDTAPVVKVIDFGVAKAVGVALTDQTLFTGLAQMVGTPLYMSPEQAGQSGLDVDTRADVYSLGVLLYELLTGTTPFDKDRFRQAAYDEIRRIIREEDPPKPSTRLSEARDALPSVAAQRHTEPAKLTRLVRGELDWIVMKALEKDRSRRYETANGFAADVQRYLADEPVAAGPPGAAYRLRKFARRNRARLGVAAALGLLIVGAGAFAWQTDRQAAQRRVEASALLDQCEEALRADRTDRAALALGAAERRAPGGTGELGGRLARCRADLELLRELDAIDTFRWTPAGGRVPMNKAVADRWRAALAARGLGPEAAGPAEAAARLDGSPVRDRVLGALDGWLAAEPSAWVRAVLGAADPDPYRDAVRDALAAGDRAGAAALAGQDEALAQPARFAAVLGHLPGVPAARQRAVLASALGPRPGDLDLLMALGTSYPPNRRGAGAGERIRWFQAAVAAHPGSVAARNNLGLALLDQGDPDGALAVLGQAVRLDPEYASARANLGLALRAKGDGRGALASFREAVRLDPQAAWAHKNLGAILLDTGNPEGALASLREAVRLDPEYASAHYNRGLALRAAERLDDAIAAYREAVRLDPGYAEAHVNLGVALRAKGDRGGALAHYREAARLDPQLVAAQFNLGVTLLDKEDWAGAAAALTAATRLDPQNARAHCHLGRALRAKGDPDGALAAFREAVRLGPRDAEAHNDLGFALRVKGDREGAIGAFREAVRLDPQLAIAHFYLGSALQSKRDRGGAVAAYREAVRADPKFAVAYVSLGRALREDGDPAGALTAFQEAIRADAEFAMARDELAWLMATGPDRVRDVKQAVEHAARACELSQGKHPNYIATLAAAHAAAGDFDRAVESQKKAHSLMPPEKRDRLGWPQRLLLYERKQAYRDTAHVPRERGPSPRAVNP